MKDRNFESISTTEICKRASVSRNTFYNYYADKYALLEDCFSDFEKKFHENFAGHQKEDNPEQDIKKSYLNLVDTFFDMETAYESVRILSSFDLMSLYYRASMHILETYESRYVRFMNPDYDYKQLNSFLVLGFWGFIHANPKMDMLTVQKRTRKLVLDLLDSPIFKIQPESGTPGPA